jgi:hypothetical protein
MSVRAPMRKRIDPSNVFRATLPVNPSVTMTSAMPSKKSRPSTLPTKSRPGPPAPSARRAWVSLTRGDPFDFSSPMERSATRGCFTP